MSNDNNGESVNSRFPSPESFPRGILTKTDREFLLRKEEFSTQEASNKRFRLRERVVNAMTDFVYLDTYLEQRDKNKIMDDLETKVDTPHPIYSALAFFYSSLEHNEDVEYNLEDILHRSIMDYERRENPEALTEVNVQINVNQRELTTEEVISRFANEEAEYQDFNIVLERFGIDDLNELQNRLEGETGQVKFFFTEGNNEPLSFEAFSDVIQRLKEDLEENNKGSQQTLGDLE